MVRFWMLVVGLALLCAAAFLPTRRVAVGWVGIALVLAATVGWWILART